MQWTYQEYVAQPEWFTDILAIMDKLDAAQADIAHKKAEAAAKAAQRKRR